MVGISLNQINKKSQWRLHSVCATMLFLWRQKEEKAIVSLKCQIGNTDNNQLSNFCNV